ncbi:hypothetical protein Hanom_Chr04g00281681 [Helianthus anomalus]
MRRVYPILDGYWISFKNFVGYGSGMGLGDTRPDYPKSHTRLPELYTYPNFLIYTCIFINLCLLLIYFRMFIM